MTAPEEIAHYRVVERLGSGGMGIVLLAEDTRLNRRVALKILPPQIAADSDAKARLFREARLAASLDHPNICAIYEVGDEKGIAFIAMQFVDGETLGARLERGRLAPPEALQIGIHLASALAEAHAHGIIHRDLKPANIILTKRGEPKILDFGLARITAAMGADETSNVTMTRDDRIAGTLSYMSPEQLNGEALDARSDIFSLGLVLYEMVTQVRPFSGSCAAETISRTLTDEPKPLRDLAPDAPESFAAVVARCLAKSRNQRPASADEVCRDLMEIAQQSDSRERAGTAKKSGARRSRSIDSVAVLPFENATADAGRDYIVDGITESIINCLARLPRLRVMARSTVFHFKGRDIEPADFGRQLEVQAVLTGRVAEHGGRIIVSAELLTVRDGAQIWGGRFDAAESDILSLPEQIAEKITTQIRTRISTHEKKSAAKQHKPDPEAYRLYLQGRYWWNKRPQDGFVQALDYFQQSIDRDPLFAPAFAGLADACATLGGWESGLWRPRDAATRSLAAARRALELDEKLGDAYAPLCYVYLHYEWKFDQALEAAENAIKLTPGNVNAHHWLSHLFMSMGAAEKSLDESHQTTGLDPLDLIANVHLAWHFWLSREPERALEQCRKTLELHPNTFWPKFFEGLALELQEKWHEAADAFRDARRRAPAVTFTAASLGHALGRSGQEGEAMQILDELTRLGATRYVPAYDRAIIHLGVGDLDRMFTALGESCDERSSWMAYLDVEPRLDAIRNDSRFLRLRQQVGLP